MLCVEVCEIVAETERALVLPFGGLQRVYLHLESIGFHAGLVCIATSADFMTTKQTESAGTAAGS